MPIYYQVLLGRRRQNTRVRSVKVHGQVEILRQSLWLIYIWIHLDPHTRKIAEIITTKKPEQLLLAG